MNYLHSYHAGHFTDVFKHIVLIELLLALKKKDKPFCYIETHGGFAIYDLYSKEMQTTQSYQEGIAKLWETKQNLDPFKIYMDILMRLNEQTLHFYPGSVYIAHTQLRAQDKILACDLNHDAYQDLKLKIPEATILCANGYQQLNAWLPPPIKRGLVFIDPPFEDRAEFNKLPSIINDAVNRWPTGIFCVWYPIKDYATIENFYKEIKKYNFKEILISEFCPLPCDVGQRLNGSGMLIINPPWQLEQTLKEKLPILLNYLRLDQRGHTKVFSSVDV